MQTQDFYSGLAQLNLHPLSSSFNPKLEVPLFQGFQTKPSNIQLDYGSNPPSWTFGSKHRLQSSRDISLLNNLLSDIPHLRIPQ